MQLISYENALQIRQLSLSCPKEHSHENQFVISLWGNEICLIYENSKSVVLMFLDLFQIKLCGGQLPNKLVQICIQQIAKCTFEESSQKKKQENFSQTADWIGCSVSQIHFLYLSELLKVDR